MVGPLFADVSFPDCRRLDVYERRGYVFCLRSSKWDPAKLQLECLRPFKRLILEGSRLVVKDIPIEVFCPGCKLSKTLKSVQWFYCPDCGAATSEILHGKELIITALELKQ
jgi:Zn finger protein HypA/HybF involved in hydrogenase expression